MIADLASARWAVAIRTRSNGVSIVIARSNARSSDGESSLRQF